MCMYLLGFVVIFSTISSDYVEAAITGKAGRYMGLIIWLAFIMAYVFISKFYYLRERELRMFAISFMVMCIFGAIQFVGYDPFYMFAGTGEGAKKTFIGFIGNINVYGGYLCFGVPLAAYLFCFEKRKVFQIVVFLFPSLIPKAIRNVNSRNNGSMAYVIELNLIKYLHRTGYSFWDI